MIEMLAAYLKISLNDAIAYLISKGIIDNSKPDYERRQLEYVHRQANYRNKLLSFWNMIKGCEKRITKTHEKILYTLTGLSPSSAICSLFGFSNKAEVVKNFAVSNSSAAGNGGCNRIFVGSGWEDVCLLPAFDMPGRIKTMIIFGRPVAGGISTAIRHVCYKIWTKPETEAGLIFFDEAVSSNYKSLILETNTAQGIRIAADYIDKYKKMPQLMVLPPELERSSRAWLSLSDSEKNIIVTGPRAGEFTSISPVLLGTTYKEEWSNNWVGSSKWISECINKKAVIVKKIVDTSPQIVIKNPKCVTYNGDTYEECPNEIVIRKNGKLIADFIVKVNKVFIKRNKTRYIGYVQNNIGRANFKVNGKVFRSSIAFKRWIIRIFLKNNLGQPVCKYSYTGVIEKLSLMFSEPKVIDLDSKKVGEKKLYKFANYSIDKLGNIKTNKQPKLRTPGAMLINEELNLFEKEAIGDAGSEMVWACAIPILGNAIAKLVNKKKVGIGVNPDCFPEVKVIAEYMGCANRKITSILLRKMNLSGHLEDEFKRELPIVFDVDDCALFKKISVEQVPGDRNCLIEMSKTELNGVRTITRWVYIDEAPLTMTEHLSLACRKLTVSFLSEFIAGGCKTEGNNLIAKTVSALSRWCTKNKINLDGLLKGFERINHDLDKSDAAAKSESFKILAGELMVCNKFDHLGKKHILGDSQWIACKDFYHACQTRLIPVINKAELSKALLETKTIEEYGVVYDEKYRNVTPSWRIRHDYLKEWESYI